MALEVEPRRWDLAQHKLDPVLPQCRHLEDLGPLPRAGRVDRPDAEDVVGILREAAELARVLGQPGVAHLPDRRRGLVEQVELCMHARTAGRHTPGQGNAWESRVELCMHARTARRAMQCNGYDNSI